MSNTALQHHHSQRYFYESVSLCVKNGDVKVLEILKTKLKPSKNNGQSPKRKAVYKTGIIKYFTGVTINYCYFYCTTFTLIHRVEV